MSRPQKLPELSELRAYFKVDAKEGLLFFKKRPLSDFKTKGRQKYWNKQFAGKQAGCTAESAVYSRVMMRGKEYSVARIVWSLHFDVTLTPDQIVDHIDGNKKNNAISNLRLSTYRQNSWNTKAKAGLKGAIWHPQNKRWISNIRHNGKRIHLGYFDTAEEAHAAYIGASKVTQGEFSLFSRP